MISRKTAKKLASLSAVSAGALVLTGENAAADVMSQSFLPNPPTVGFQHHDLRDFGVFLGSFSGLSYGFGFSRTEFQTGSARNFAAARTIEGSYFNNVRFATNSRVLQIFGAGAVWGTSSRSASSFFGVAGRLWGQSSTTSGQVVPFHFAAGDASFQDGYALFTIDPNGTPLYGWVELSLSVTDGFGGSSELGPNLAILGYGFDDSGNQIAAGSVAPGSVPEPGSLSLLALALGAVGLRQMRAARKNQAA